MNTNLLKVRNRLVLPAHTWSAQPGSSPDGDIVRSVLAGGARKHFLPIIAGAAQGHAEVADVIQQLEDGTDTNELWSAYQQAVQLRNRERQPIMDFLTYRVTRPTEGIPVADSEARFERASEYGVPRSYRPGGQFMYMGFDFNWYDLGLRFTWEFLSEASTQQVDAMATQALEADNVLLFQLIMWTLFNNENRDVDIKSRPFRVYSAWNGDGEVPPRYRTNTFDGTHNHYLVSGAATVDSVDLDDMEEHLHHHGYKRSNGYNLVVMVNKEQGDTIRTFRSVQNGGSAKWDFIPAQGTPAFMLPRDYVRPDGATNPPAQLRGMEVIGTYGELTVVQEDYIPPKYMAAFATGGEESIQNPIGLREHSNQALRGLRLVKGRDPDYPLQESFYQRGIGTGIRHRGALVIMQVKAAGAYAVPAEYSVMP